MGMNTVALAQNYMCRVPFPNIMLKLVAMTSTDRSMNTIILQRFGVSSIVRNARKAYREQV